MYVSRRLPALDGARCLKERVREARDLSADLPVRGGLTGLLADLSRVIGALESGRNLDWSAELLWIADRMGLGERRPADYAYDRIRAVTTSAPVWDEYRRMLYGFSPDAGDDLFAVRYHFTIDDHRRSIA